MLAGFTQAAALLIIASQIPALIGLQGPLSSLWQAPQLDLVGPGLRRRRACCCSSLGKRYAPRLPIVLLVIAAAGALSKWSGYSAHGAVIGTLPAGLPAPYWPGLPGWESLGALVVPALVIALVSSLEMAASAKIESQRDGKRWDASQDLIGQGVGKLAAAFSGSFPTSTSFSRSAITLYAGARTGWATVLASGVRPAGAAVPHAGPVPRAARRARGRGRHRRGGPVQAAHPAAPVAASTGSRRCTGAGDLRRHAAHGAADLLGRAGRRA